MFDHRTEAAKQNESKSNGIERAALPHDADIEAWRAGTLETLDLISEGDILAIKQVSLQKPIAMNPVTNIRTEQQVPGQPSLQLLVKANCRPLK